MTDFKERPRRAERIAAIIERMRHQKARHAEGYRGADVVDARTVDDWADELEDALALPDEAHEFAGRRDEPTLRTSPTPSGEAVGLVTASGNSSPDEAQARTPGHLRIDAVCGVRDFHIEAQIGLRPHLFAAIQRAILAVLDEAQEPADSHRSWQAWQTRAEQAEQQIASTQAALSRYGAHESECGITGDVGHRVVTDACTCGFEAALADAQSTDVVDARSSDGTTEVDPARSEKTQQTQQVTDRPLMEGRLQNGIVSLARETPDASSGE